MQLSKEVLEILYTILLVKSNIVLYSKGSMPQKQYKPHYEHLKNKWTEQQRELEKTVLEKHKDAFEWLQRNSKNIAYNSMGGLLLFTYSLLPVSLAQHLSPPESQKVVPFEDNKTKLIEDLSIVLPAKVQLLSEDQEKVIGQTLSRHFNLQVSAELQGKRLNRSYGLIGAEQHLMRYPGDTIYSQFPAQSEHAELAASGMAPGRGAWGYFAPSKEALTEIDTLREKYYIAVPTFLSTGYAAHTKEYSEFFKYRKMLVVNPENGKSLVADIADAGPSPWTGKHLGGSPEVMQYLERVDGSKRGPVLYFFINDTNDSVPLGPINVL